MAKPKLTAVTSLDSELAGLITTRTNLQARQTALTAEVEQAVVARRELLIQGAAAAAIADAERACREVEGTAFGIADALTEVERRIVATEAAIAEARTADEREAAAAMLERDGKAIDTAAERVRRAVEDLAKAGHALAAAISPTAAPLFAKRDMHGLRDGEPPERVAAYLIGHMIATGMPLIEVSEASRNERFGWVSAKSIEPNNGDEPHRPLPTELMRELASRVRAGEASPELAVYHRPEPDFRPAVPEIQIYVIEPFRYVPGNERIPVIVTSVVSHVPKPVAERAIAAGYASTSEPKNIEVLQDRRRAQCNGLNIYSLPDLGFDLKEWIEEETTRQRSAWLAEQGRKAA